MNRKYDAIDRTLFVVFGFIGLVAIVMVVIAMVALFVWWPVWTSVGILLSPVVLWLAYHIGRKMLTYDW